MGSYGLVGLGTTLLQTGQIIIFSQDISDSLDEAARLEAIVIDFSKAFDLVPHDRFVEIDSRMVVWIREFLIDRSHRVRVGSHYSEEVRVMSGVPKGSVLGPQLYLA